jgi:hypothetical protein
MIDNLIGINSPVWPVVKCQNHRIIQIIAVTIPFEQWFLLDDISENRRGWVIGLVIDYFTWEVCGNAQKDYNLYGHKQQQNLFIYHSDYVL